MNTNPSFWRVCSSCKKPIPFRTTYYVCSVSTCTGQRTGYVFCTVGCFETHLPGARHRSAGAIEKTSPAVGSSEDAVDSAPPSPERAANRTLIRPAPVANSISVGGKSLPREVVIIASRLKEYIQARADFNTSAAVMDVLSDYVRVLCDRAIDQARAEGRKTVLERDFDFLKDK